MQTGCDNSAEALGPAFPYRSTEGIQEVVDLEEVGEESLGAHIQWNITQPLKGME